MNAAGYFETQAKDPKVAIRIHGGLLERPTATPPAECGTNAYVCSIQTEDFDVCAARIVRSGGQVALPKIAVRGRCWQGYFVDPAGNTFGLFQVDGTAA